MQYIRDGRNITLINKEVKGKEINFVLTPADTRFPGFVNSLGDHMITTSAFAVSAALSYYDNNCGELKAYDIDFSSNKEFLRGFVRVAALLHDIGKPPPKGHADRTKDIVYSLFKDINQNLAEYLSEAASRHHYGFKYSKKPGNFIEWIIAYADKASASSRAFLVRDETIYNNFVAFAERLQSLYDIGGEDYIKEIRTKVETAEDDEDLRTYGFLSKDENKAIDLAKELINAENRLCNGKELLALFHFEIPSIKSYLNRGRELSIYSGYSIMIDSLIHDVSDIIKAKIGKEVVISDEGGALLSIVPSSFNIKDITDNVDLKPFDAYRYNLMKFSFAEAHLGPKENWKGWNNEKPLVRDSLRGFGALINKFFASVGNIVKNAEKNEIPLNKLCKKCRINEAVDGEVCESCKKAEEFYKTFRGLIKDPNFKSEISEKVKRLRIYKIIQDLRNNEDIAIIVWNSIDDLNKDFNGNEVDLNKRRFPVLLVGDGDNFGQLKSQATTLTQYLEINRYFTYMIYYSIYYALENTSRIYKHSNINTIEFQPILLGGDDFSIILTSQELLPFIYYMDEALQKIGGRITKDGKMSIDNIADEIKAKKPYQWFGISVGGYIYKDTAYPLFLARENAEELEHISKQISKTLFQKKYYGSGLVVTIMSDKSFSLLDKIGKDKRITIMGSDVIDVWKDILDLENANVNSRKIFDYIKLEGDELHILYDVARNNPELLKTIGRIIIERKDYNLFGYIILLGSIMDSLEQRDFNNMQYYKLGEVLVR